MIAAGVAAVGLLGAATAWACTPPNGTTVVDGCVRVSGYCQYVKGTNVTSHAVDTVSHTGLDNNWKLFFGTEGKWCMSDYTLWLRYGPTSRNADPADLVPDGYVPADGLPVTVGTSDMGVGKYEICWNNGNGGGDTAVPDVISIVRK